MTEPGLYQAAVISSGLRDLLDRQGDFDLVVHSVFKSAANLLSAKGTLVTLASAGRDLMPMGMLVSPGLALQEGQRLRYREGVFHLSGAVISTRQAEVRPTSMPAPLKPNEQGLAGGLSLIRKVLTEKDRGGIASLAALIPGKGGPVSGGPLNHYSSFIFHDLTAFLEALGAGDFKRAGELARRLVGFGPGLTPSCDDFLSGVLLSLYYDASFGPCHPETASFFEQIKVLARDRTSLVSRHMLCHAAAGHAGTLHLELLEALVQGDFAKLVPLARRLLSFGASSGADFLLGLYCAQLQMPRQVNYPANQINQVRDRRQAC